MNSYFSQTSALSGKNVLRFIREVGDRMTNMAVRMEERDGWFEDRTAQIDALERHLLKLHDAAVQM